VLDILYSQAKELKVSNAGLVFISEFQYDAEAHTITFWYWGEYVYHATKKNILNSGLAFASTFFVVLEPV
jgi:hypothetical protein